MNRKELLTSAAAMVAAATSGFAFASRHEHMDAHHGHEDKARKHQKLMGTAADCVQGNLLSPAWPRTRLGGMG